MMQGGGTLLLASHGKTRGPGHSAILSADGRDWLVHHMYDADNDGIPTLQIRPLVWAHDDWPLAGEPIKSGSISKSPLRSTEVAGRWRHSVNFGAGREITFLANGKINRPDAANTWNLNGRTLCLRWPRPDGPQGVWVDECYLNASGEWYVGRNQRDMAIRGKRSTVEK